MAGLEAAVRAGDVAGVVQALADTGEDPRDVDAALDADGHLGEGGALHLASFLGCLAVLEVLLHDANREDERRGGDGRALRADLQRGTTRGATALICAALAGQEAAAALLLGRGAELETKGGEKGDTALLSAARHGRAATAAALLDRGADGSARNTSGATPLMLAAQGGRTAMAALLLDRRADVAAMSDGWTALMIAASCGHTATVALLLDCGSEVTVSDSDGWTALMLAAQGGRTATAALLLDRRADVAATDSDGWTALTFAADRGHTATVALLLDRGSDLAVTANNGGTALMCAARKGHTAAAALLLDRGADADAVVQQQGHRHMRGMTALMFAAQEGHTTTAALLLDRGADLAAKDDRGRMALTHAANKGHTQTAALLAEVPPEYRRRRTVLALLHGWCQLRIAATFRLHDLLRRALRTAARDPPTAAAAAAILAASRSRQPELPGWAGLPVCAVTVRLVRQAVSGWSPSRHWLHHGGFRAAVHTLLLVNERGWRLASATAAAEEEEEESHLPLPVELWFVVCGGLRREDFACGPPLVLPRCCTPLGATKFLESLVVAPL